jgi:bisphosphoglycerate-independent phosphoglycerate mutase (AlkP superfamily)
MALDGRKHQLRLQDCTKHTRQKEVSVCLASLVTPGFKNGETVDAFATVMDIAPTILEMAGLSHPAPQWLGREVVPMRGASMTAWGTV